MRAIGLVLFAALLPACGGSRSTVHDAEVHHHRHDHGWHLSTAALTHKRERIARMAQHHAMALLPARSLRDAPPADASAQLAPGPAHRRSIEHAAPPAACSGSALTISPDTTYDYAIEGQAAQPRTRWNTFAVASVPLFIATLAAAIPAESTVLLLIGCALTLASAVIGARQCRDRGERGQGFAMAVMGFAAAGFLISLIALLSR